MLPTVARLEVAVEILEKIEERRRDSGDPDLGTLLEYRIIQRELDLLETEWLGRETAEPPPAPRPDRKRSLFERWFGRGTA
jgi:hypothetical protein